MAAYKVTRIFTLQFNIYNIADEYYFDTAAGAGYAIWGAGRYVSLSGRAWNPNARFRIYRAGIARCRPLFLRET